MKIRESFHESYEAHRAEPLPSNRKFGLVMVGFFTLIGTVPLLSGKPIRIWALALVTAFVAVTLVVPRALGPLNRIWMRVGVLLGHIVGTLSMALLFGLVFTPVAL